MQTIQLISLRHSAFYTPYLMTFTADFLSQQGLKAEYHCVNQVDELESALLDGTAHVAQSAVGISMKNFANRTISNQQSIFHFAQINQRDGFFIAAASQDHSKDISKSQEFNWRCLENKRLIADHLFQPIATLKYVLEKNEVDVDKVEFIDAGDVHQSITAFKAGKADFIHLQGPYPQQLVAEGHATIVASVGEALGEIAYSSLCATSSWLKSPMAKQFLKAYQASVQYVNKTGAQQLAQQLLPLFESIDVEILSETIQAYKKLSSWSNNIWISKQSFQKANDVFLFSGDVENNIEYKQIVYSELNANF